MTNPGPHCSDAEFLDTSSDSDDTASHQRRRQQRKDHSKAIARHIAAYLRVLMLLTLRFAALRNGDGDLNDDVKSNSVDIDEGSSASGDIDLGKLSSIASQEDATRKDVTYIDNMDNSDGAMDLDNDVVETDAQIPDTDLDLRFIPRQYDKLDADDDDFLNKVIESGAYQSWQKDGEK